MLSTPSLWRLEGIYTRRIMGPGRGVDVLPHDRWPGAAVTVTDTTALPLVLSWRCVECIKPRHQTATLFNKILQGPQWAVTQIGWYIAHILGNSQRQAAPTEQNMEMPYMSSGQSIWLRKGSAVHVSTAFFTPKYVWFFFAPPPSFYYSHGEKRPWASATHCIVFLNKK
ncbi:hypothetical protein DL89DRAFT_120268 [Linderina pennispora]|uniref:Uncharacterized protein n=1 Tax=Linderina pennispora TaxID=61395 RepID=A0A1Y1WCJ0_9FUNG|nr:uncharacterized protein DL89DRAFT_120268 [Linderina pennispora]ORX71152.1 hypothetical protein DL89DRAFT_120268 [Linderina pennispora]